MKIYCRLTCFLYNPTGSVIFPSFVIHASICIYFFYILCLNSDSKCFTGAYNSRSTTQFGASLHFIHYLGDQSSLTLSLTFMWDKKHGLLLKNISWLYFCQSSNYMKSVCHDYLHALSIYSCDSY